MALKASRCFSTNGSVDVHDATSNDGRADSRNHSEGKRGGRNRDDGSRGSKPRLGSTQECRTTVLAPQPNRPKAVA